MAEYIYPVGDIYVSCSFGCHKARNPPSIDPGTDYACAYGTPVKNIMAGTVVLVDDDAGGAAGKQVGVRLDNGMFARYLHLSSILVYVGQRLAQGHTVGRSGASGWGDFWYYGPHLHLSVGTSLWSGNVDFEKLIKADSGSGAGGGGTTPPKPAPPTPPSEEDEMSKNVSVWYQPDSKTYIYMVFNATSGFVHEFSNGKGKGTMPGSYTAGVSQAFDTNGWTSITASHAAVIKSSLAAVRPQGAPAVIGVQEIDDAEVRAFLESQAVRP